MTVYPSVASIKTWLAGEQPAGVRDDSLWGYAYAAKNPTAFPPATQADFTSFETNMWNWVLPTHYWTGEFLLAYISGNGDFPSGPDQFTSWLASKGYARKNADGSYAIATYPVGGADYPPAGGTVAANDPANPANPNNGSTSAPPAGGTPTTPGTPTTGGGLTGIMAQIQANPIPWVVGAGAAALLLLKR